MDVISKVKKTYCPMSPLYFFYVKWTNFTSRFWQWPPSCCLQLPEVILNSLKHKMAALTFLLNIFRIVCTHFCLFCPNWNNSDTGQIILLMRVLLLPTFSPSWNQLVLQYVNTERRQSSSPSKKQKQMKIEKRERFLLWKPE